MKQLVTKEWRIYNLVEYLFALVVIAKTAFSR